MNGDPVPFRSLFIKVVPQRELVHATDFYLDAPFFGGPDVASGSVLHPLEKLCFGQGQVKLYGGWGLYVQGCLEKALFYGRAAFPGAFLLCKPRKIVSDKNTPCRKLLFQVAGKLPDPAVVGRGIGYIGQGENLSETP